MRGTRNTTIAAFAAVDFRTCGKRCGKHCGKRYGKRYGKRCGKPTFYEHDTSMRKIIQISTTSPFYNEEADCPAGLYALCNDGSIWTWVACSEGTCLVRKGKDGKDEFAKAPPPHWERMPGLPAEDADEDTYETVL